MSGKTAEKAATVVKAVDTLKEQGKDKEAAELRRTLNTKPVSAAYRKASGMGLVPKPEPNGHPPEPVQAALQQGSILPSGVTVHCGDARRLADFVTEPVHLVITSPPYNVGVEYGTHDDLMEPSAYRHMLGDVFQACFHVMAAGARLCVVVPAGVGRTNYQPLARMVITEMEFAGLRMEAEIVWDKGQATVAGRTSWGSWRSSVAPRLRDRTERILIAGKPGALPVPPLPDGWLPADLFVELTQDLWAVAPESAQRIGHPAPFPVELTRRLIRLYAFPGAHVLDPFAGSGTVGVAAIELDCTATLIDIDAGYCEIARRRCAGESALAGH
jgi:site-specific DNA-methyltransferase (adenine-specific)